MEKIIFYNFTINTGYIKIKSENSEKTSGTVKYIDEFGYIMVELPNGEMVSLQPGNNSFDMMQGLIMPKKAK